MSTRGELVEMLTVLLGNVRAGRFDHIVLTARAPDGHWDCFSAGNARMAEAVGAVACLQAGLVGVACESARQGPHVAVGAGIEAAEVTQ